ncbi:hypothetical protein ACWDUI_03965 [Streptosporangium sandarakinum]
MGQVHARALRQAGARLAGAAGRAEEARAVAAVPFACRFHTS